MAMNSEKLESYVNNLVDLSKLSSMRYDLNIKKVNLSDMVRERLERCKKLYIAEKNKDDREFVVEIEPDVMVMCDEYYIGRSIEYVIINAIQCKL